MDEAHCVSQWGERHCTLTCMALLHLDYTAPRHTALENFLNADVQATTSGQTTKGSPSSSAGARHACACARYACVSAKRVCGWSIATHAGVPGSRKWSPKHLTEPRMRRRYPDVPLLALTATATPRVQRDVVAQLALQHCVIFRSSFNRANLRHGFRQMRALPLPRASV